MAYPFTDSSNLTGMVEDIDFICGTNSTSYPLKDKARNMNRWAHLVFTWELDANRTWQLDDANQTDHNIVTTALVADQQDYTLPTEMIRLDRVEVKNSAGDYEQLRPIDQADIEVGMSEFQNTSGLPRYYDIYGGSIWLYPAPASGSVTLTAGLKLFYIRNFDEFLSTDTAQELGFAKPFARLVALGACYDFFLAKGEQARANQLRGEIELLKRELKEFHSRRDYKQKPRIVPRWLKERGRNMR